MIFFAYYFGGAKAKKLRPAHDLLQEAKFREEHGREKGYGLRGI